MHDKLNSYITVLVGFGVFLPVVMTYDPTEDEYKIGRTLASRRTHEAAKAVAEAEANKLGLEVR